MDRATAIRKARYFRVGATVINCDTGDETHYTGRVVSSHIDGQRTYADFNGNLHSGPRYRRSVKDGPSIAAAKRATRGLRGVVTQRQGENLRAIVAARVAKPAV